MSEPTLEELNETYRQLVASNAPGHEWGCFEVLVFDAFIVEQDKVIAIQKARLRDSTIAPDPALDVARARAVALVDLRKRIEVQLAAARARRADRQMSYKVR